MRSHRGSFVPAPSVRSCTRRDAVQAKKASKLVLLWVETGAARIWLPELGGAGSGERGVVDKLPRDPVLITAFLASDPPSLLTRLKCSNKDIERGRAIKEWRDKYPDPKHLPQVRKWLSEVGEYVGDLLALLPATTPHSPLPTVVQAIHDARDPITLKELAVSGDDLLTAGVRPGPDVGATLTKLLGEVLEDPARNTKEYLLSRV